MVDFYSRIFWFWSFLGELEIFWDIFLENFSDFLKFDGI